MREEKDIVKRRRNINEGGNSDARDRPVIPKVKRLQGVDAKCEESQSLALITIA